MKNAVIYARFSSDLQREESIDAQVRACREYAAKKGLKIIEVYSDEAVSGRTANRTQYQRLLRDCQKKNFEIILIHKYDRIGRSLGEHVNLSARLDKLGIELIAVSQDFGSSAEAKIMKTLVWSMSEYYVDNLAAETKKGLKENALKALHNGGVAPFGYDIVDKKYVINDFEAEYVRKIFSAAIQKKGFTEIIRELSDCGIKGKRGKPIKYSQIYEILRNEKYTGVYVYSVDEEEKRSDRRAKPNAIRIEGAIPVIIDRKIFEEVQKIMNERKQTGKKADYLCSGLVYCKCGAKMHGMKSVRKGHTYHYFTCSEHCGASSIRMEDIDNSVKEYLCNLLDKENQEKISHALRTYKFDEQERSSDFNKILKRRINEKQKRYDNLLANLSTGLLPAPVVADIGKEMEKLKSEIECLKNTEPPKSFTADIICNWLDSIKNSPNPSAVRMLVERIDIKDKTVFNIQSTLKTVLGKTGCSGSQHILPKILFKYIFKK